MGNKKINQLPSATSVGNGDVTVIYQNGITKQIPVSQIGGGGSTGGGIEIPTPIMQVGKYEDSIKSNKLFYQYYPVSNSSWLDHSPMIFLFRYVGRKIRKVNDIKRISPTGFKHPRPIVDRGFLIRNDFGIIHNYDSQNGVHSEWTVSSTLKPYQHTELIDFAPYEFFTGSAGRMQSMNFPVDLNPNDDAKYYMDAVRPSGRRYTQMNRSAFFEFRFGIRNPNNTDEVIFGNASNRIKAFPLHEGNTNIIPGVNKVHCIGIGLSAMDFPPKRMTEWKNNYLNGY